GRKQPAFDHQAMAQALASDRLTVSANDLPFREFEYGADRRSIAFEIGDARYVCDLTPTRCRGQPAGRFPPEVLVSPDGRWGVLTRAGNLWLRELATGAEHALTTDGVPDAGYGIYPDDRGADYIPRERLGRPAAPVGARWAPTSARVFIPFIDQRHV